jgi:hypothetical protein
MTFDTPSKLTILTLLICMLPVAARSPFGHHDKLISLPKTVFQYPLAEANHRNLQTDEQVCEFLLNEGFREEDRLFCGCERLGNVYQVECRFTDCLDCEIIQDVETCAVLIEGVDLNAETLTEEVFISCVDYESGFFDSTICVYEKIGADSCTVTVNDVACNSCVFAACDDGFEDYSVDCSNVAGGDVWNFCNADVPETSPFVAFGNNNLFFFDECFDFTASPSTTNFNTNSPTEVPSSAPFTTGPNTSPQTVPQTTALPTTSPLTASPPSKAPATAPPSTAPVTAAPSKSVVPSTSAAPSRAPMTAVPSTTSSSTPSTQPSNIPSDAPSMVPFSRPSTVPSDVPSIVPSARPSIVPSTDPSDTPSMEPSILPSIASIPDENRSSESGGLRLSIHTLILVASAVFVANVC